MTLPRKSFRSCRHIRPAATPQTCLCDRHRGVPSLWREAQGHCQHRVSTRSVRFAVSPESNGFSSTSTAPRNRPIRPIRAGRRPRPISWSDRFVTPVTTRAGVRDGRVLAPDGLRRYFRRKGEDSGAGKPTGRPRRHGGLDWHHRLGFSPVRRLSVQCCNTARAQAFAIVSPPRRPTGSRSLSWMRMTRRHSSQRCRMLTCFGMY